jgi:hypothetical protein
MANGDNVYTRSGISSEKWVCFCVKEGGNLTPPLIPSNPMGLPPSDIQETKIANRVAREGKAQPDVAIAVKARRR